MVFFVCLSTRYYFLSLFVRIRIEAYFALVSPTTNLLTKSLFKSFVVGFGLRTTENNEVSSANNFPFDERPSARSFIYFKNRSGPSMEP